jgi:AraC-like DNA-binding protein/quercetin dioxygenase-like cupin family protein
MQYAMTQLQDVVTIRKVVSIHYFEYARDYAYEGERHDFWEFLYVDKGEVDVCADGVRYRLAEGDIIFHKPDEFHTVEANGRVAPNLIVCAFACHSRAMKTFEGRILHMGSPERDMLALLIREARTAFLTPMNKTDAWQLERNPGAPVGAEQRVRHSLEDLLILLLRREQTARNPVTAPSSPSVEPLSTTVREQAERKIIESAIRYMEDNANRHITFAEVCAHVLMGESALKALFRKHLGCGVVACATRVRIEAAKRMIRESGLHFSDIAEQLGWSSVHHFSRQFKKTTGMTPSQYARSALGHI